MKKTTLFILFILISVMGIVSISAKTIDPEARLTERVKAMMTAKVEGDWKKVYPFLDENYRNKIPKTRFERGNKVQLIKFHIESIQMDPSNVKAQVLVRYDMVIMGVTVEKVKENQTWIIETDDWFLKAKPITGIAD